MAESPVADSSPVIVLAQAGRLDLLRSVGERVILPRVVVREIERPGLHDAATQALRSTPWLEVVEPGPAPPILDRFRLGRGETAVLTWALAHPGTAVIMDDQRGRRAAGALRIPVIGTLGVIISAKLNGTVPAARPVVEHLLRVTDWYIAQQLLDQALARVGE